MPTLPAFRPRALDDPTSLRVIAALDAVGTGRSTVVLPAPSREFRADLRAQLVAVAPRLVAEGVHAGTEAPPRHASTASTTTTTSSKAAAADRRPVRTRPMTVLVAGTAVVVLGMGGATWLARGALPGDALYGLKRTAEGVDVSLTGSDLDKGHALLVDASTRVQEVNDLLARPQSMAFGAGPSAAGALSDDTVALVVTALQAADTDTHKGVTTIGDDAIGRGDTSGLELVVGWAAGQRDSIDALVDRIPDSAAKTQAQTSATEIRAGLERATLLLAEVKAGVTCQHGRDEFGPEPCGATASATTTPDPTAPATGGSGTSGGPTGSGGGAAPITTPPASTPTSTAGVTPSAATTSAATTSAATTSAAAAGAGASSPVLSVPVAIDTCGVQVSLPVAGVSLGTCTPSP